MTKEQFVENIVARPEFQGANLDTLKDSVERNISVAIDRIAVRFPFRWAMAEAVVDGGSVDGQEAYDCPGENNDAMDIHSVRYGSADSPAKLKKLDKLTPAEYEDLVDRVDYSTDSDGTVTDPVNVEQWVRTNDEEPGLPRIILVHAPGVDDYIIRYRYMRRGVSFKEFPEEWTYVLTDAVLACLGRFAIGSKGFLIPSETLAVFEKSMGEMIDYYDQKAGHPQPVKTSKHHRNRNILRNYKHGY